MNVNSKKNLNPEQALAKARSWCAFQERCHKETKNKLYEWGLFKAQVELLISTLISEGFLNEERFAKAYAGGKFRIKHWGKLKIRRELEFRDISEYCIRAGIQEISDTEYRKTIRKLISIRQREVKEVNPLKKKQKIFSALYAKGYESEVVSEVYNELKSEEEF